MQNALLFNEAVSAIDTGNALLLETLLARNPWLLSERGSNGQEGYFKDPYLLWHIAGNPIRQPKLADNITAITSLIIEALKKEKVGSMLSQINYTLALVCSGSVSRESGAQLTLIDLLIAAGADPTGADGPAAAHHENAALEQLLKNGLPLSLITAICTERTAEAHQLITTANAEELQKGLAVAALYGNAEMLAALIKAGADIQAYCPEGFHSHSTPLHQAIWACSITAVKVLVEAGANLHIRDRAFFGTPFGWAIHAEQTTEDKDKQVKYAAILYYMKEHIGKQIASDLQTAGLLAQEHVELAVPIISKKLWI